jgi:hypothetical protein
LLNCHRRVGHSHSIGTTADRIAAHRTEFGDVITSTKMPSGPAHYNYGDLGIGIGLCD